MPTTKKVLAEDRAAAFKEIKEKIEGALFKKHASPSIQANVPSSAANVGKMFEYFAATAFGSSYC